MGTVQKRELWLVRGLEHLHPSFREPLEEIGARVYDFSVSGEPSVDLMNRLYAAFLHALCGSDYQVFVHHFVWDLRDDALADLVRQIESAEPSAQLSILTKRDLKRMKLNGKAAPYRELTFSTRRREALEILFESGDTYIGFEGWLLGHRESSLPLDFMRRMYFEGAGRGSPLLPLAVRNFPAVIDIREFHGPLVYTTNLPERYVIDAVMRTASELDYPLHAD